MTTIHRIYFDNAATTSVHPEVIDVMTLHLSSNYGNPSSTHSYGRESKAILEESRRRIAQSIGAKPSEVIFTSCGTESNNSVINQILMDESIERIITTAIEHPSIYATLNSLKNQIEVVYVALDSNGKVILSDLELKLKEKPNKTLVTIMHANNEVGILNDIKSIGLLCKTYQAIFHSDMVQTMGHIPIDFSDLHIDFASASAHKFHGPKGVGFLYIKQSNKFQSFIKGGSQERGFRSGTENLASIAGMAKALELTQLHLQDDINYINSLRNALRDELIHLFPDILILTKIDDSLCTVLSVLFPEAMSHDMLLFQLDMKGIACSGGSACSSGAGKESHVLAALNTPKNRKAVRFSFCKYNNMDEIAFCVEKIKELASEHSH